MKKIRSLTPWGRTFKKKLIDLDEMEIEEVAKKTYEYAMSHGMGKGISARYITDIIYGGRPGLNWIPVINEIVGIKEKQTLKN